MFIGWLDQVDGCCVCLQAGQMKSMVVAQSGSAASQTAKPMGSKAATGL